MRSSQNNHLLHPLALPVLLFAVVLGVYYPALLSGIHTIDDPSIVSFYAASPPLSRILLPGGGYYYRPLLELSFWMDHHLWGLEPSVMHLENLLLHIANALLVFLMATRIAEKLGKAAQGMPLCAALLFALHPVNVESVAWIAGRSDLMLAFFGLSACYLLLGWLDRPRTASALAAVTLFALAFATKEVAVAFVPVAMLLIWSWPEAEGALPRQQRVKLLLFLALASLLLALAALALRGSLMALGRLVAAGDEGFLHLAAKAAVALGFYLRKLFAPFPLNFAIVEVSPLHAAAALAGLLVIALLLRRRLLAGVFFCSALLLVAPALLLALRDISWTPYAERYLYLPTAFFSLGIAAALFTLQQKARVGLALMLLLLLAGAGFASRERAALWQDKRAFYQDAIAKSPGFGSLQNELGMLHLQQNELDQAAAAFAKAELLNKRPSMVMLIRANLMRTMVAKGEHVAAREYFLTLFRSKQDATPVFLESLQKADSRRLPALPPAEKGDLSRDLIDTLDVLYRKTKEPFWLYRSGLVAREIGSYGEALEFFRQAYAEAPPDASYRPAAGKQIAKLEEAR